MSTFLDAMKFDPKFSALLSSLLTMPILWPGTSAVVSNIVSLPFFYEFPCHSSIGGEVDGKLISNCLYKDKKKLSNNRKWRFGFTIWIRCRTTLAPEPTVFTTSKSYT